MNQNINISAIRGSFIDFVADPFYYPELETVRYIHDGLMIISGGIIQELGNYDKLKPKYPEIPITSYPGMLILPGFIDIHIHYPQTEIIASSSKQLLEWLDQYTFPVEGKFQDKTYAQQIASFFLDQLLKNGTTSALVLTTVYPQSVDALFEAAELRNMRIIAGKMLMDRNAPDYLLDTPETSYEDSKNLIKKWHGKGRLLYAITPRFAITSTPEQLHLAGVLKQEFPDVYVHTHLSEQKSETEKVAQLFPNSKDYLGVYENFGLVSNKSIFAHGIYLSNSEFNRLSQAGSTIAFCPTSNLFLGSGLFPLHTAKSQQTPVKVGLGTDVGGGTSFSIFQTMNDAYKISQLQEQNLSSLKAFYLATLGGAKSLSLEHKIGNFDVGKKADLVVLDTRVTPLLKLRNYRNNSDSLTDIIDELFTLIILGDERVVQATYVAGNLVYEPKIYVE
ncbi:guanine deaminase [Okeania sp. SIO2C9]|uniref:guanine deaminase n=1 Tax=Okeania sp. SIO2C9 TaxID=2607791 RepID=UPI0025CC1E34|nr:guanine deaminase [Okeania sp. SIO2C9]